MANVKKQVIKKDERKVNNMDWKRKRIALARIEEEIVEVYKPDAYGPVCVHCLPDGCGIKGASMCGRISYNFESAEQIAEEVGENLQGRPLQMQSMRILGHPFKTERNVIVLDSLETGSLSVYEPIAGNPLFVEHSSDECIVKGAALVGEIGVVILSEEKKVIIDELYCEYGYEELEESMMEQVQHCIRFYKELGMLDVDA